MKLSKQAFTDRVYSSLGSPTESELPRVELFNSLNFAIRQYGYFCPQYFSVVHEVNLNEALEITSSITTEPILDVETVFVGDCSDYGTPIAIYKVNDDLYSSTYYRELDYYWDSINKSITIWGYEGEVTIWFLKLSSLEDIPDKFYKAMLYAAEYYCLDFIIMVRSRIMELRGSLKLDTSKLVEERDRLEILYKREFKFAS